MLTPPPPSYATATARARQLHESMLKFVHEIFSLFSLIFLATQTKRSINIALNHIRLFDASPLNVALSYIVSLSLRIQVFYQFFILVYMLFDEYIRDKIHVIAS